ncbi:TPA: AzlC family ABC transporter permease [Campylobacter fetus subsp. venerealis]|uniref:Branched-chain amino acid ABC transporter permease n=4 Tax=Campylobacter fetus TaxID=196 RepID=A0A5L8JVZ2_CAMFE|nr:AzlC family ABC transporter permease [Campylobacter fetus]ABK81938.1 branched-chain amino acid transport protein [Campylobacter fetus subsp. fetus 82-40]OCS26807.1 branched-chain amino acid ABC transporter [Campylobacter fetus subsp. venerealis cfvB10]OCS30638.1 branched-chain amino acid ABC transporter [Campylobacter fetus subsp. venerealis LMG 6570 = CCUG 33900]AIR78855.1 branched-chain amino acid transport protein, AzlC family [Campylobacter fetus subsp. fetus 04/554]AIR80627.1 branched-
MSKFEIFKSTIPVMMGYIPLGLAFGLYGVGSGLPIWVMSLTSIVIYAGSVEFLLVAFIVSGSSLSSVFFISFLLNFRHFFYTMAMLNEIKSLKNRIYFIYALTDETFAILKSRKQNSDENRNLIFNMTALLNQSYWIFGVNLGAILGSSLNVSYKGIDFSLSALFAILTYQVFKNNPNKSVLFLGIGCSIIGLFIFPQQYFLFGTLIFAVVILLLFKRYF